jgi:hypothetical protein
MRTVPVPTFGLTCFQFRLPPALTVETKAHHLRLTAKTARYQTVGGMKKVKIGPLQADGK